MFDLLQKSGLTLHGVGMMPIDDVDYWVDQWCRHGFFHEFAGEMDDSDDEAASEEDVQRAQRRVQAQWTTQVPFDADGGCPLDYLLIESSPDVSLVSTSD